MKIAFYGDSLTEGIPGVSTLRVLAKQLPEHELLNYGKGGDTVISLFRRIVQQPPHEPVDIAFLWIGVNDVFSTITFAHSMLKRLMRQPRVRDHAAFRDLYDRTLTLLRERAKSVVTVSPLLTGEDLSNPWNHELAELCEIVSSASTGFGNVHHLDLRARFSEALAGKTVSDYVAKSLRHIVRDAMALRTPDQVDAASSDRGLHLTLDGVHLNSAGAELAADAFLKAIKDLS